MGKKVYAVKEGFDSLKGERVQNKIYSTWNECLAVVKGVKGAKYKSFQSIEDAKEYLKDHKMLLIKGVDPYPSDCIQIYVDGSYNTHTKKYSYALVVVEEKVIKYMESGVAEDSSESRLRQILGELKAALRSYEYAIKNNKNKIVLFHDYEGIFHHAIGTWDRKDSSSKFYYEKFNEYTKEGLEVVFVKVDSHTGDLFNEITDNYAKVAAGLEVTGVVDKLLKIENIYVENEEIKEEVIKLLKIKDNSDNIILKGESRLTKSNDNCKEDLNVTGVKLEQSNFKEHINKLKGLDKNKKKTYLKKLKKEDIINLILEII
ncbi:ribonuclease H family protein [Hathewaya histolytica]|uniref:Ribonuclease H1-like n=1 Tax=Hathewaya histolytica TaxID=1498 RepID=A0A4U9QYZ6_HATHI|nr:ribonuclease H family protein [Hathewaya histolytica]VTQ83378.1 Ribonuclease H1-like [Hathewaya histolytica]